MIEDAQIGFYAAWLVAQADGMPTWNKGDEFEAARLPSAAGHSETISPGAHLARSKRSARSH